MLMFFVGLTAILLVALLSRDHDLTASQEAVVTAELNLGPAALAQLPDRIHLARTEFNELAFLDRVRAAREGLVAEGFADAGAFRIDELPGVCVVLMANPGARMTAAVYDHERAGVWVEAVSRYDDGYRCTHTTLEGDGLGTRPGNTLVALPGVSLAELLARARADRPAEGQVAVGRHEAATEFEEDYAEWIAARKALAAGPADDFEDDDEELRLAT